MMWNSMLTGVPGASMLGTTLRESTLNVISWPASVITVTEWSVSERICPRIWGCGWGRYAIIGWALATPIAQSIRRPVRWSLRDFIAVFLSLGITWKSSG